MQIQVEAHKEISKALTETYRRKNTDYGNSFGEMYEELGIITAVTRIGDKYSRLKNLAKKSPQDIQVKSETVKDTLLDMANYCIMTVIEIESSEAAQNKKKVVSSGLVNNILNPDDLRPAAKPLLSVSEGTDSGNEM